MEGRDNESIQELDKRLRQLTHEVQSLREYLQELRLQQYIQALLNTRRIALMSFLSGIMSGLGAVIGATLVLSLLVYILGRLEVLPVIGDWVAQIVKIVRQKTH